MFNCLQDALRALDDEELERFIRWLKMDRELRIANLWKQLKDLMSKEVQPDNAYMHADTAGGLAFFEGPLQAILRCMIVLIGIGATCIGIVKDEW